MNLCLKAFIALALIITIVTSALGYRLIQRQSEILQFFDNPDELALFKEYVDKKINFCDAPWGRTEIIDYKNEQVFASPSKRYLFVPSRIDNLTSAFRIVDSKSGEILIDFSFGRKINAQEVTHLDIKWTENEKYVLFRRPIYMDDDWLTSYVYVGNVSKGTVLYMGDSAFYDCALRHW